MTKLHQQEVECHVLVDDDGYTLTRYVEGEPRMYGEARFTFRPVPSTKRARIIDGKRGLNEESSVLALAKTAVSRIIQWNLKDKDGKPLPVTVEAFLNIHPILMTRVFGIVIYSSEGGDTDPLTERTTEQLGDIPNLLDDESDTKLGVVDREQKNS